MHFTPPGRPPASRNDDDGCCSVNVYYVPIIPSGPRRTGSASRALSLLLKLSSVCELSGHSLKVQVPGFQL